MVRKPTRMMTRIREVRRSRGLTLQEVAERCDPPTTPQTIGRLETGTRTVSVGWLNRIAGALAVEAADLVELPGRIEVGIAATLDGEGAHPPRQEMIVVPPQPGDRPIAVAVTASIGDYRSGDEIWMDRIDADRFAQALNRDVLVPRPGGRFLFGRLIGRDGRQLQILPPGAGNRQIVVGDSGWLAVAVKLIRNL